MSCIRTLRGQLGNFVYFPVKKVYQIPLVQFKMTADLEESLFRPFIDVNCIPRTRLLSLQDTLKVFETSAERQNAKTTIVKKVK